MQKNCKASWTNIIQIGNCSFQKARFFIHGLIHCFSPSSPFSPQSLPTSTTYIKRRVQSHFLRQMPAFSVFSVSVAALHCRAHAGIHDKLFVLLFFFLLSHVKENTRQPRSPILSKGACSITPPGLKLHLHILQESCLEWQPLSPQTIYPYIDTHTHPYIRVCTPILQQFIPVPATKL